MSNPLREKQMTQEINRKLFTANYSIETVMSFLKPQIEGGYDVEVLHKYQGGQPVIEIVVYKMEKTQSDFVPFPKTNATDKSDVF